MTMKRKIETKNPYDSEKVNESTIVLSFLELLEQGNKELKVLLMYCNKMQKYKVSILKSIKKRLISQSQIFRGECNDSSYPINDSFKSIRKEEITQSMSVKAKLYDYTKSFHDPYIKYSNSQSIHANQFETSSLNDFSFNEISNFENLSDKYCLNEEILNDGSINCSNHQKYVENHNKTAEPQEYTEYYGKVTYMKDLESDSDSEYG